MDDDIWTCPRCNAENERWRRWCRSCPMVQDRAAQPPPAPAADSPAAVAPIPQDRVHPALVLVVLVAILASGLGAYLLMRPGHRAASATAAASAEPTVADHVALNDDQVVEALTFTSGDAPSGWSFAAVPKDDASVGAAVVPCSDPNNPASAPAKFGAIRLSNADWLAVEAVDVQTTTQAVVSNFNTISNGAVLDCIRQQVVADLGPLLRCTCTGVHAEVVPMVAPPLAPDTTYAYRFTIDVDGHVVVQADAYFIADGRAEIALLFASKSGTFPSDAEARLLKAAIDRLHATPTSNKTT